MTVHLAYRQRGATLMVSLVLLLVITLLAISSMREVTLEERIIGNLRDKQVAFNATESALREGEKRLARSVGPAVGTGACAVGQSLCLLLTPLSNLHPADWTWWTTAINSVPYQGTATDPTAIYGVANVPRWQAAFLGFDPMDSTGRVEVTDPDERSKGVGPYFYNVNASAQGRTTRMMVTLQSSIVQRY